jgi:hypothetical protein
MLAQSREITLFLYFYLLLLYQITQIPVKEMSGQGQPIFPGKSLAECKCCIHRTLYKLGGGKFLQNSSAVTKIFGVAGGEICAVLNFRRFACNPLETGDAKGVLDTSNRETASVEEDQDG